MYRLLEPLPFGELAKGGAAKRPSRVSLMRINTTSSSGLLAPAGGFQSCASRARNASISLCDSCAALPLGAPSVTVLLTVLPAVATRRGVGRVDNASDLSGARFVCR